MFFEDILFRFVKMSSLYLKEIGKIIGCLIIVKKSERWLWSDDILLKRISSF